MKKTLILASSSINRFELLNQLRLDFEVIKPEVNETQLKNELAQDLVMRLAEEKAKFSFNQYINNHSFSELWVIGSDQVLEVNKKIFGKPYDTKTAKNQLNYFSEKTALFHTSISLVYQKYKHHLKNKKPIIQNRNIATKVVFKKLTKKEICTYLRKENPLQCAGSFKSEGLGLSLLSKIESSDHSAIIGLPLISLTQMLAKTNYSVL